MGSEAYTERQYTLHLQVPEANAGCFDLEDKNELYETCFSRISR